MDQRVFFVKKYMKFFHTKNMTLYLNSFIFHFCKYFPKQREFLFFDIFYKNARENLINRHITNELYCQ